HRREAPLTRVARLTTRTAFRGRLPWGRLSCPLARNHRQVGSDADDARLVVYRSGAGFPFAGTALRPRNPDRAEPDPGVLVHLGMVVLSPALPAGGAYPGCGACPGGRGGPRDGPVGGASVPGE